MLNRCTLELSGLQNGICILVYIRQSSPHTIGVDTNRVRTVRSSEPKAVGSSSPNVLAGSVGRGSNSAHNIVLEGRSHSVTASGRTAVHASARGSLRPRMSRRGEVCRRTDFLSVNEKESHRREWTQPGEKLPSARTPQQFSLLPPSLVQPTYRA